MIAREAHFKRVEKPKNLIVNGGQMLLNICFLSFSYVSLHNSFLVIQLICIIILWPDKLCTCAQIHN